MALIGEIRKRSWLLMLLIGLALFAFILMDSFSGERSIFGASQTTMANIAGRKIDITTFNRTEQILYSNATGDPYARKQSLWNYFVEESILNKESESLGLGVSRDELMELQFGQNISPIIQQRFANPNNPRAVDRGRLDEFKTAIETDQLNAQYKQYWGIQEKEIIKDRLQTKLNSMVSKAMFTPSWMVDQAHADQNQRIDFEYVQIPFDEVDNAAVNLTDADYSNFLANNKAAYYSDEESRKVAYVVFDVKASLKDSTDIRAGIESLIPKFRETTDDSTFVETNYGSMDPAYVKKDALSPAIADEIMNSSPGTVYGPYIDGNAYKAVKVIDKMVVADSVKSRHILRSATNPTELSQAFATIDSLKRVIESGQNDFASLAKEFSQDQSNASKGGELGYAPAGRMVPAFNNLIFYEAEKGKVYSVVTRFGVHLVEVQDRKFLNNDQGVKVAYLSQSIIPSDDTQNEIADKVYEFIGKNRDLSSLIESVNSDPNLEIEYSSPLKANDYIVGTLGGGQASRDIVKFAFSADVNEVAPDLYRYSDPQEFFENKYVVAALQSVIPKGMPSVASIKSDIEQQVINVKKGDILANKIQSRNLANIAQKYNSEVDTAKSVNFQSAFIPGLGSEPKVIAAAFNLNVGETSPPVVGTSGVFLVKVNNKPDNNTPANIAAVRKSTSSSVQNQVRSGLIQALKKNTTIEDFRSKFY